MTNKNEENDKSTKPPILDQINKEEAIYILRELIKEIPKIESRIEELALSIIDDDDDIEEIGSEVYFDLNHIEIEEVWDQSGNSLLNGYVDPQDAALEIIEEALSPYTTDLKRYQDLKINLVAKKQYLGILAGIYQFHQEASTEFKDFVEDIIREAFGDIRDTWKEWCKDSDLLIETDDYIEENMPDL